MSVTPELARAAAARIRPLSGRAIGSNGPHEARTNLPAYADLFIGRAEQIAALALVLRDARLITLTGTAGVGKTRLGVEVARQSTAGFGDGVWFVDLAGVTHRDLVIQTVLDALHDVIRAGPGRTNLANQLGSREALLLLDGCEYLTSSSRALLGRVLRSCPGVKVLATSRHPLGVAGEQVWCVPPLGLPARDDVDSQAVSACEAVRLFVDRAKGVCPGFRVDAVVAPTVAAICRRLDGLPLAVELAAARLAVLSPTEIESRLDDPFPFLRRRVGEERHRSLQAALDWSHDRLKPKESALLRRLAILTGWWTPAAASTVCSGGVVGDHEVIDLLDRLVAESLVLKDGDGAAVRYRMFDTTRRYSREKLADCGELEEVAARHAVWCRAQAEISDQERGERRPQHGPEIASSELLTLGQTALRHGDLGGAEAAFRCCVGLTVGTSDRDGRSAALSWLGEVARIRGDYVRARSLVSDGLELVGAGGPAPSVARGKQFLARVLQSEGSPTRARTLYKEVIDEAGSVNTSPDTLGATLRLGEIALVDGDIGEAARAFEQALAGAGAMSDVSAKAEALAGLSLVAAARHEPDRAVKLLRDAVVLQDGAGDALGLVASLYAWAALVGDGSCHEVAARLLGAATAARDRMGLVLSPDGARSAHHSRDVARAALGPDAFARAYDNGYRMTLAEAASYALSGRANLPRPARGWESLSGAEREVVQLVSCGLTNHEIGAQLVISPRTVSTHLTHIYRKLAVGSRRELARFADQRERLVSGPFYPG